MNLLTPCSQAASPTRLRAAGVVAQPFEMAVEKIQPTAHADDVNGVGIGPHKRRTRLRHPHVETLEREVRAMVDHGGHAGAALDLDVTHGHVPASLEVEALAVVDAVAVQDAMSLLKPGEVRLPRRLDAHELRSDQFVRIALFILVRLDDPIRRALLVARVRACEMLLPRHRESRIHEDIVRAVLRIRRDDTSRATRRVVRRDGKPLDPQPATAKGLNRPVVLGKPSVRRIVKFQDGPRLPADGQVPLALEKERSGQIVLAARKDEHVPVGSSSNDLVDGFGLIPHHPRRNSPLGKADGRRLCTRDNAGRHRDKRLPRPRRQTFP